MYIDWHVRKLQNYDHFLHMSSAFSVQTRKISSLQLYYYIYLILLSQETNSQEIDNIKVDFAIIIFLVSNLFYSVATRRVWRYQRCNQNPYIEEIQTTQWPKEKDKNKYRHHNSQKKYRQHNGQKKYRQHNSQKKYRQHNGQKKKDKRKNNDLQNTTQKTTDRTKCVLCIFQKWVDSRRYGCSYCHLTVEKVNHRWSNLHYSYVTWSWLH